MRNTLMSVGVGLLLIVVFLARPMAGQSKAQRPTDIEIKLAFDFCEWYPPKKERMLCEKKLEPESKRGIEASKKLRDEILDKLASFNKTSQFGLVQAIVRVKFWRENKAPPTDADVEEFFRATF